MSQNNAIVVSHLTKTYGSVKALDDVSVKLEEGKIYGLLGRNGAGKTTLLNIINNRIFAEEGTITINGMPNFENDEAQQNIYYMSEQDFYPEQFKVKDVFYTTKLFYPGFDDAYAQKLCDAFELNPKKRIKELSTGYKSIYKLITALAVDAPYIFLDEPVLGLDANHRELFYQLLLESYSERPRTIVISTHLIEEVSGVLEEVIIVKKGKIIRQESCEKLLHAGYTVSGKAAEVTAYAQGKQILGEHVLGGLKTISILGSCDMSQVPASIEVTKLDLQKLFIQLTGE